MPDQKRLPRPGGEEESVFSDVRHVTHLKGQEKLKGKGLVNEELDSYKNKKPTFGTQ